MEDKTQHFLTNEVLKNENRVFIGSILTTTIGYFLLSFFLNSIRANANIVLLWILIIIQFILYFSIFIISYKRLRVMGWNNFLIPSVFLILAVLGRVNDWEILIIPLLVIIMILLSVKNKKMSDKMKGILQH